MGWIYLLTGFAVTSTGLSATSVLDRPLRLAALRVRSRFAIGLLVICATTSMARPLEHVSFAGTVDALARTEVLDGSVVEGSVILGFYDLDPDSPASPGSGTQANYLDAVLQDGFEIHVGNYVFRPSGAVQTFVTDGTVSSDDLFDLFGVTASAFVASGPEIDSELRMLIQYIDDTATAHSSTALEGVPDEAAYRWIRIAITRRVETPSGGSDFRLFIAGELVHQIARPSSCGELDLCLTDLEETAASLSECRDALDSCLGSLPDDLDWDGVPDEADLCGDTRPDSEVDSAGCSLDQFCSLLPTTRVRGPLMCLQGDWKNDEPRLRNPRDCALSDGRPKRCVAAGRASH